MDVQTTPTMTVKMKFKLLSEIKDKLTQERLALFSQTCFGRWLQLTDTTSVPLLLYKLLQKEMNPPPPGSREDEIFFQIGDYSRRFGRADFCLLTGLPFGPDPELDLVENGLCMRLFGCHTPRVGHVYDMFKNDIKGPNDDTRDNFGDQDVVRLCLILMVERFFIGHELATKIKLQLSMAINNLGIFANYPWGSYIWDHTVKQMRNCIGRRDGNEALSVFGFLYALKIWILETFPGSTEFYSKDITVYPRAFRWTKLGTPKVLKAQHVRKILDVSSAPPLPSLVADNFERSLDWYRNSMAFIGEVQEAHHQDQQPAHQPGFQPAHQSGYQPGYQQWQERYTPILDSLVGFSEWRQNVDTQLHGFPEWRQNVDTQLGGFREWRQNVDTQLGGFPEWRQEVDSHMRTYREHWRGQAPPQAPPQQWQERYTPILDSLVGFPEWRQNVDTQLHGFPEWRQNVDNQLAGFPEWRQNVDTQLSGFPEWRQEVDSHMRTYREHWRGQAPPQAPPQPAPQAPPPR